ncbi:MAG TPA: SDR family NAD(P)-dependent oxidoreductase, partial [Bacillales bacterium]|nr:SDR family NAD(P)-dependent oxidoreductase [Bacillales bacterium]
MNMALVTGVSKGLGYEIAKALIDLGIEVIGLSRSTNEKVADIKVKSNDQFTHIPSDLANVGEIEPLIKKISQQIATKKPQKLYVINNASVIEPIERMGFLENSEIQQAVHLNLLAPIFINNTLMGELRKEDLELVIINVSSGAAERPIHGWSVYNATKAAINMHTKVVALEQENGKSSHKIIAFSPGIMDTDMQGSIREANEDAFAEINKFIGFKLNSDLRQPSVVAKALVDLILNQE